MRVLEGHITESAVSLATDNKWALSAGGMWDLSSGRRIWSFGGESGVFTTATLSDNNRWVLLGTKDGKLQLWELDWDYEFLT